ncbi:MAG: mechanosensitive ion channel [Burkholderiales bacterium]|nr:mechanosensitive ion channel [Burkholderiales bacterium]
MIVPVEPLQLEAALTSPGGWLDLALVGLAIGIAWAADRRLHRRARAADSGPHTHLQAGVGRVTFALLALALLALDRVVLKAAGVAPVFVDIAIPLLVALAVIRVLVYLMRQVFAEQAWLKTSERTISFTIWGFVVLHFLGVLPELAQEIDALVIPIGRSSVSLLTIAKGAAAIVLTLVVTLWLSGLLEQRLLGATTLDSNVKALLAKFLRAVLLAVGALFALQAIGFDLTLLTVFGGALGVGIGLGLQKLAANYIAGFTILLDRSVRMGDLVTVDNRHGRVTRVTSRYVVVRSQDGVDAIVPNETLVVTTVLNHSSAGRPLRASVTVPVAHDADVDAALRLMEEIARTDPGVAPEPAPPAALLTAITDLGITLDVGFSLRDPQAGPGAVRSAISRRIYDAFRANGIELAQARREPRQAGPAPGRAAPTPAP